MMSKPPPSIERAYSSPEIIHQRLETLKAIGARPGERVLDAGCGPGLLTVELARQVGEHGAVVGVDKSEEMLARARERCGEAPQCRLVASAVESMDEESDGFDAVVCTQVLLYVADVRAAVAELRRVLKPGGRLVIIETDWRSCVLGGDDFDLNETMIRAWDDSVPSPNLPVRLGPMLRALDFKAVRVDAIPVLATSLVPGGYADDMTRWFSGKAVEQGKVDESRARQWLQDLRRRGAAGDYFFCANRFLFFAVK